MAVKAGRHAIFWIIALLCMLSGSHYSTFCAKNLHDHTSLGICTGLQLTRHNFCLLWFMWMCRECLLKSIRKDEVRSIVWLFFQWVIRPQCCCSARSDLWEAAGMHVCPSTSVLYLSLENWSCWKHLNMYRQRLVLSRISVCLYYCVSISLRHGPFTLNGNCLVIHPINLFISLGGCICFLQLVRWWKLLTWVNMIDGYPTKIPLIHFFTFSKNNRFLLPGYQP